MCERSSWPHRHLFSLLLSENISHSVHHERFKVSSFSNWTFNGHAKHTHGAVTRAAFTTTHQPVPQCLTSRACWDDFTRNTSVSMVTPGCELLFFFLSFTHEAHFDLYVQDKDATTRRQQQFTGHGSVQLCREENISTGRVVRGTQPVVTVKGSRAVRWGLAYVSVPASAGLSEAQGRREDGRRARSPGAAFCMSASLDNTCGSFFGGRVHLKVCVWMCGLERKVVFQKRSRNSLSFSPKVPVASIIQSQMGLWEDEEEVCSSKLRVKKASCWENRAKKGIYRKLHVTTGS